MQSAEQSINFNVAFPLMYDAKFFSSALFLLSALGVVAYALYARRHSGESRIDVAMRQFQESAIHSNDPRFAFEGRSALVVRQDEDHSNGENTTYALTVYARNQYGEYFVFRSDGNTPSVNYLEHRLARIILKHDYGGPLKN